MADSQSSTPPIAITVSRPDDRRGSVLSTLLPQNLTRPPPFLSTSPFAREILQNDIDEAFADEPRPSDSRSCSSDSSSDIVAPANDDAKLAFHPSGVVYGIGFSSIPLPGVDRPVPNPREIEESLQAEVSLLRDNGVLPPKQHRGRHGSVVDRVYHAVFNLDEEIPGRHTQDETSLVPGPHGLGGSETTPLLHVPGEGEGDYDYYGAQTPLPKDVHKLWEEAVAAHHLKTT